MRKSQYSIYLMGILCLTQVVFAAGPLTVTPSITSTTIRSDSESEVLYTVTNNTGMTISDLSITPGYLSTASDLSIFSNNCTSTLSANGICTFKELITGNNQPTTFIVAPRVCAFSGSVCAKPTLAQYVNVTINQVTAPVRAYFNVVENVAQDTIKAIAVSDGVVSTGAAEAGDYDFTDAGSAGLSLSPNGETLYAINTNTSLPALLSETDVSSTTPPRPSVIKIGDFSDNMVGAAVSPDGRYVYIAGEDNTVPMLFIMDTENANTISTVDLSGDGANPFGVAVSPDGARVYVTNGNNTVSVVNPATEAVVTTITDISNTNVNSNITGAVISPDGTRLYVCISDSAGIQTGAGVAVINTVNNTVIDRITDVNLQDGMQPIGIDISPNGNTLYIAENGNGQAVSVDLTNGNAVTQLNFGGALSSPVGIAVTPDGTALFVSNAGATRTAVKLVLSSGLVTATDLGGSQTSFGKFIG